MRKKTVFCVLLVLVSIGAGFASADAAGKIVWRAQSSYPAGLPQLYAPAAHFAKLVSKMTGGQLVVKMHPGGSIVPSKQIFDAVSSGTLDLGCTWS
ncbi:MAG: hypothetical protein JRI80_11670 [Deltaproteobacteria bacterium]|nr:hypothetical protein [Deltaproteobacteria bacterium]